MTDAQTSVEVIASKLTEVERRYILAAPLLEPSDAGLIAYHAGEGHGRSFALFVRRNRSLFQRCMNKYHTAFEYRLSVEGQAVRAHLSNQGVK